MLTTNRLHMQILAQRQPGYNILFSAVRSSLNDDAATVKQEMIKQANLADIPIDGKQFDTSWEERPFQVAVVQIFTILSPPLYAQDVKHALLVLLENINDTIQYPATHNYAWFSQTRFDPSEQMKKHSTTNKLPQ